MVALEKLEGRDFKQDTHIFIKLEGYSEILSQLNAIQFNSIVGFLKNVLFILYNATFIQLNTSFLKL